MLNNLSLGKIPDSHSQRTLFTQEKWTTAVSRLQIDLTGTVTTAASASAMMTRSTISSARLVLLLVLGPLHASMVVESFSSFLSQPMSASTAVSNSRQSIIRPGVLHRTTEAATAATLNHHPFWSPSALRVATGILESPDISSSGSDGDDGDEDDNGGLPEFGADGMYHITNEDEYK